MSRFVLERSHYLKRRDVTALVGRASGVITPGGSLSAPGIGSTAVLGLEMVPEEDPGRVTIIVGGDQSQRWPVGMALIVDAEIH